MLCPRCEQGDVVKAKIIAEKTFLFVCKECEASWFLCEDIGVKAFIDFGVYMESIGLKPLWSELQIMPE
jgi:transcription elongation factor Elf1